ncbi:hypothetical protein STAS_20536 [Striga asiatica]|uniref:Uncharacterized protein n=1 Tax=Striga asiatica TaxID=4170 RepID=A0A5A7QGX8_STRAF|nr:hypothetical protein STAS_20536 [Striga asiatica]
MTKISLKVKLRLLLASNVLLPLEAVCCPVDCCANWLPDEVGGEVTAGWSISMPAVLGGDDGCTSTSEYAALNHALSPSSTNRTPCNWLPSIYRKTILFSTYYGRAQSLNLCYIKRCQQAKTDLIRFATCFTNFSNNDISVDISIHLRISFYSNKAMLFAVVEPMARSARSDNPLELIGLHPYYLLHTLVTPKLQAAQSSFAFDPLWFSKLDFRAIVSALKLRGLRRRPVDEIKKLLTSLRLLHLSETLLVQQSLEILHVIFLGPRLHCKCICSPSGSHLSVHEWRYRQPLSSAMDLRAVLHRQDGPGLTAQLPQGGPIGRPGRRRAVLQLPQHRGGIDCAEGDPLQQAHGDHGPDDKERAPAFFDHGPLVLARGGPGDGGGDFGLLGLSGGNLGIWVLGWAGFGGKIWERGVKGALLKAEMARRERSREETRSGTAVWREEMRSSWAEWRVGVGLIAELDETGVFEGKQPWEWAENQVETELLGVRWTLELAVQQGWSEEH